MLDLLALKAKLSQYIQESPVVVAVSGGPDSMFLLWLCQKFLKKEQIIVAHFEHGIRKESNQDALLVHDYCLKHELTFVMESADIPTLAKQKGLSVETCGREARYLFLRSIKIQYKGRYILVAHHRDDQVETILLHFFRGSGIQGLSGMPEKQNDILRPLLEVEKKEILTYCKKHRIPYTIDKTNLQSTGSRNLIRLEILPLIRKINPHFEDTMLQNMIQYRDIAEYIEQEAMYFLKKTSRPSTKNDLRNRKKRSL